MTPGWLLLGGALALACAIVVGRRSAEAWLALTGIGTLAAFAAAGWVLGGGADWEWRSGFVLGGETLHLRLDGVSALFLALAGVVGVAGAIYSREYWGRGQRSAARGRAWWSGLLLSIGVVLVASNGLHFLIGWELFTVCAYFLVTLDRRRRAVRQAGWLYLAASHAGAIFLFAFFSLLAARTGSWELGPWRERTELAPLFWLALLGFGVKAGLFPLHVWLPSAHASAPSHVSAILSGVAIKLGVYGIVRFSGWLPLPDPAGWTIIGLGTVAAVVGIACAMAQDDLKRLLAYSSVENVGVIMIGLGAAVLGAQQEAPWGMLALAGALLHVWNHGLFKSLLFLGAGAVLHATGTREMSRLGGLWRAMPWTTACFATGAAAVAALPPCNGFVSEWLLYLGLFDAAIGRGAAAPPAMLAILGLGVTGALALASFIKAAAIVFLGAPRTQAASRAHEAGLLMRGPMVALALGCLALGLVPWLFLPAIVRAAGSWRPGWAGVSLGAPVDTLGNVHLALALALAIAAAVVLRRTRALGVRREPTWDCGYSEPTPRMQYTSGAFAGTIVGWLPAALRQERVLRRPRGLFPARAFFMARVPEAVLERVVTPVGRVVMRASTLVRRLQHGRVQFYLIYVLAGLAALATIVVLEGRP